ncbi:MAG: hypothetical protein IT292_11690 [Deltaproteobacteria bacterium]|nr:hypothetical protein [Deltaproteobacteria bacterium]
MKIQLLATLAALTFVACEPVHSGNYGRRDPYWGGGRYDSYPAQRETYYGGYYDSDPHNDRNDYYRQREREREREYERREREREREQERWEDEQERRERQRQREHERDRNRQSNHVERYPDVHTGGGGYSQPKPQPKPQPAEIRPSCPSGTHFDGSHCKIDDQRLRKPGGDGNINPCPKGMWVSSGRCVGK